MKITASRLLRGFIAANIAVIGIVVAAAAALA